MIGDAALPPGFPSPVTTLAERSGICFTSARWRPEELTALAAYLEGPGAEALAGVAAEELLEAWSDAVEAFLDPASPERCALESALPRLTGLSPEGLQAGLEAILGGVRRPHAAALLERARDLSGEGLLLVVLAGNVPGLAVQPLLPALALRRPVAFKASSSEPLFTPAFVRSLGSRLPALAQGLAALTWPGGEAALEEPLLAAALQVVAYGGADAMTSLRRRARGEILDYGPKLSFAVLGEGTAPESVAPGLARDIALFDQNGCLSIQAVFTAGAPRPLAEALARALEDLAGEWPPGAPPAAAAAQVHQLRAEARMRGLYVADLPLRVGTVVVEPLPELVPSPGLRTVRVHSYRTSEELLKALEPFRGRLQGAALAGADAWALERDLEALGVTRCMPPGELQSPDASWHNGGRDPLLSLAIGPLSSR